MKTYAMGGYGAGNLGDDAIFLGLLKDFPEAIQIYVSLASYKDNIWYGKIKEEGFPESAKNGDLIIGGGGIFHSKNAVHDFLLVVEKAKLRSMNVVILKIGAEYLSDEFAPLARDLCNCANFISVRSKKSKEILERIGVISSIVERDFTYNIAREDANIEEVKFPKFENPELPTIGLVTAGNLDDMDKISNIVKFLLTEQGIGDTRCNVLFIPHSRHYTDYRSNDVVTGEMLWSMVDIYHDERYKRFKVLPFPKTAHGLFNVYSKIDGIIGLRYHSFIFSELFKNLRGTPIALLGLTAGEKATSYFEETKRSTYKIGDEKIRADYCEHIDIGKPLTEILRHVIHFVNYIKGVPRDKDVGKLQKVDNFLKRVEEGLLL